MNQIKNFLHDESGAAAVEYGMLVALIAAVIVTITASLGGEIRDAFTKISTALKGAVAAPAP